MGYPSLTDHLRTRLWLEDLDKIEVPMALRPDLPFGPVALPPTPALESPLPRPTVAEPAAPEGPSLPTTPADHSAVLLDVSSPRRAVVASDLRLPRDDLPGGGGVRRGRSQTPDLFHPAAYLDAGGEATPAAEVARTFHPGGPDLTAPAALNARDHLFAGETDRTFARGAPEREVDRTPLQAGGRSADVPRAPILLAPPPGKGSLPKPGPAGAPRSPLAASADSGAKVERPGPLGQALGPLPSTAPAGRHEEAGPSQPLRGETDNTPPSLQPAPAPEFMSAAVMAAVTSPGPGSDGAGSSADNNSSSVVSAVGLSLSGDPGGSDTPTPVLSTLVAWDAPDMMAPPSRSAEPAGPSDSAPETVSDVLRAALRSPASDPQPGTDGRAGSQVAAPPAALGLPPAVRDVGTNQPFTVMALASPMAAPTPVCVGCTPAPPGVARAAPAPVREPAGRLGAGGSAGPELVPALAQQPIFGSAPVPGDACAGWRHEPCKSLAGNLLAAGSPIILPLRPPAQGMAKPPVLDTRRTRRRGNLAKWLGTQKATLAVVFTDVIDSTGLWNSLDNEKMVGVLRSHFDHGRRLAEAHEGYLIRTTGDSLLLAFRTAAAALDFVLAYTARTGHVLIQIRAGIHVGPVQVEGNEIYGATVNYAARVIGKAKGSEIWVSSRARSDIEAEGPRGHESLQWVPHRQCTLKGFSGKHLLWSVIQEEDA